MSVGTLPRVRLCTVGRGGLNVSLLPKGCKLCVCQSFTLCLCKAPAIRLPLLTVFCPESWQLWWGSTAPMCSPPETQSPTTLQNMPKPVLVYSTVGPTLYGTCTSVDLKGQHLPWKRVYFSFYGVFSWQSGAGRAVQLSDVQHGISRALDTQRGISRALSPLGGILLPLSLGLSDFQTEPSCWMLRVTFLVHISDITSYGFLTACLM